LQIMPFGNAIKNKDALFYNVENNLEYINDGFKLAKDVGAVLWTNRFPPKYLEGNENLIQDPYKMFDEVNGRKRDFEYALTTNTSLKCSGERCPLCPLDEFCKLVAFKNNLLKSGKKIIRIDKKDVPKFLKKIKQLNNYDITIVSDNVVSNKEISELSELFGMDVRLEYEINITNQNYNNLVNEENKGYTFSLVPPSLDYQNYESIVPKISNILNPLYDAIKKSGNPLIKNIPYCFVDSHYHKFIKGEDNEIIKAEYLNDDSDIDIVELTRDYIGNKKVKKSAVQ